MANNKEEKKGEKLNNGKLQGGSLMEKEQEKRIFKELEEKARELERLVKKNEILKDINKVQLY